MMNSLFLAIVVAFLAQGMIDNRDNAVARGIATIYFGGAVSLLVWSLTW